MKKGLIITTFMITVFMTSYVLVGWTLESKLCQWNAENGKKFIESSLPAFGANLNSGWFQTAKVTKPFHFGFTLNTMIAFISDEDKSFMATNPDTLLYEGEKVETATFFGGKGGQFEPTPYGSAHDINTLKLCDGIGLDMAPLVIPQVFMGIPFGFEITGRYFPAVELFKEVGELSFWSIGIKNQISKLIPLCPVAISLQGVYQQFELGDIITSKCTFINAQASKEFIFLTLYGGVGLESTKLTAKYNYTFQTIDGEVTESVKFDIEGENKYRVTAGIRYKLSIIDICADYSIGYYQIIRIGLGFSI